MKYYYCDGDYAFFILVLNASISLLAAIIISWRRHGEPAPTYTYRVLGIPFVKNINYDHDAELTYLRDTLSDQDGAAVRKMLVDGVKLSHRVALTYKLNRDAWNRIRYQLVTMGMAEYASDGSLTARANLYSYLRVPLPRQSPDPNEPDAADTHTGNTPGKR